MHGYEPEIKSIKGRQVSVCETCHREIKVLVPSEEEPASLKTTNRCKQSHKKGSILEPCYYCHLQNHHLNLLPEKTS